MGAIVQGFGGTFLEHLQYDDEGQLLTASLADYLMPTASDFPNIRSLFLDLARAPGNPLGAKGGGEGGIVAVSAAVGNAVSAALVSFKAEVRDLPLTPPRVWQLISRRQGRNLDSSFQPQQRIRIAAAQFGEIARRGFRFVEKAAALRVRGERVIDREHHAVNSRRCPASAFSGGWLKMPLVVIQT